MVYTRMAEHSLLQTHGEMTSKQNIYKHTNKWISSSTMYMG